MSTKSTKSTKSTDRQKLDVRLKQTQEEIDSTIESMEHHRSDLEGVMTEKNSGVDAKHKAVAIHTKFVNDEATLRTLQGTMADIRIQLRAMDRSYDGLGWGVAAGPIAVSAAGITLEKRGAGKKSIGGIFSRLWR
jgi:hypothetical protein